MRVTIRHGEGAASVRAAALVLKIRERLGIEAVEEEGRPGELEIMVDGRPFAWRTGGIVEHAVGLGWPDADLLIAKLEAQRAGA